MFVLYTAQSFAQKVRRRGDRVQSSEWKVDKKAFFSGDTLVFSFTNNFMPKIYCHRDAEFYTLYKLDKGNEVLVEDTALRSLKEPVELRKNEQLIIKKVISAPGRYVMKYPVYFDTDRADGKARLNMQQSFIVEGRP